MIVVVTGACSNLSSAILPRLISRPDVDRVVGLDVRVPVAPVEGVEYRRADVTDPEIAEHFLGAGAVFHLAFVVMGGEEDVGRAERINIDGSRNVFEGAIAAGVEHITYASSIASYGAHPDNAGVLLAEDSPLRGNPEFVYTRTKAEVERMLDGLEARGSTPPIARMRPCAFLGTAGRGSDMLSRAFWPVLRGVPDYPAHLAHQDDVADAFVRAFVRRARGAFNVATDDPLPSSEWPRHMGKLALPVPGKLVIAALERFGSRGAADVGLLKLGLAGPICVSAAKARRELGWSPRFPTTAAVLAELARVYPVDNFLTALRRWFAR